jgi:hypothetical protein
LNPGDFSRLLVPAGQASAGHLRILVPLFDRTAMKLLLVATFLLSLISPRLHAQAPEPRLDRLESHSQMTVERVGRLESKVNRLENTVREYGSAAFVAAAMAALWAQNTRRNAWLWFFMGAFFAPITLLVLLYKNSNDKPPHV